jgi:glyoxylase-like metal-dependent hydrolase (beta-lactamase superfamily II)
LIEDNGRAAFVDTGCYLSVPLLLATLDAKNIKPENVDYIILTHIHLDHAGGAGDLMELCNNATLIAHSFGARHLIDPSKLEAGTIAVYGEEKFRQLYGKIRPIESKRVIEAPDGFSIDLNDRTLMFMDTPGHARHHFCVYDEYSQGIFTGDTFGVSYPQITTKQGRFIFATTTPVQFDPDALLVSIDRLISLNPQTMYLTHYGTISPSNDIVVQLKNSINVFKTIALDAKDIDNDRVGFIQNKILEYLLEQLNQMGCEQSQKSCSNIIKMDTLLNAQGLDVWLRKP